MYRFRDTNVKLSEVSDSLPSEALSIDGDIIEYEIEGYRTLTVSGRELLGQDLNTVRRTNANGSIYLGASYPPRTITVKYQLKADNPEDFRSKFNKLNTMLSTGDKRSLEPTKEKKLQFVDEKEYFYTGVLSDVGEVTPGRNHVIGTFSFLCVDPFKYTDPITVEGDSIIVPEHGKYDTLPMRIEVEPTSAVNSLRINHAGKVVNITDIEIAAGEVLVFDFKNQDIYMRVGSSLMSKLSLRSNFEDFYMIPGKELTLSVPGNIKLIYEEVRL